VCGEVPFNNGTRRHGLLCRMLKNSLGLRGDADERQAEKEVEMENEITHQTAEQIMICSLS
jgi:hypothetical protein